MLSDEAEAGNAGEQPARNNPVDLNSWEVDNPSASGLINYSGQICLRKLIENQLVFTYYFQWKQCWFSHVFKSCVCLITVEPIH